MGFFYYLNRINNQYIMQNKTKSLLTSEDFLFRQERWKQHEKELEYIQGQFKPKLIQLQKMLIAKKQNDWYDFFKEPGQMLQYKKKKFTQVISNINKSLQLDGCIEKEMKQHSNKYNFDSIVNLNIGEQKVNRKECYESLLVGLKNKIHFEEKLMENKSVNKKMDSNEYHTKVDQLNAYRGKAKKLERAMENLDLSIATEKQIQIQSQKLINESQSLPSKQFIPTQTHIKQVKALEFEYQLHLQQLKIKKKNKDRIAEKVQNEISKIGLNKAKKIFDFEELKEYIDKCKSELYVPLPEYESYNAKQNKRKRQHLKQSLPELITLKSDNQSQLKSTNPQLNSTAFNKLTATSLHFQQKTNLKKTLNQVTSFDFKSPSHHQLLSPSTTVYESKNISSILDQCDSVQRNLKNITRKCAQNIKRKNVRLRNLENKLETVKVSNFLENKLILI